MATWRVSFDDPASRYIADQLDAKDASYWQQSLAYRAKPQPVDAAGIKALVAHLAPEYGVDPAFATAIAQVESNFQPGVKSSAGAKGIMQLMDGTAQRFGVRDPYDPEDNIRGGLQYLAFLQQKYPGRRDLQMAGYNAGEGAVDKYGRTIPPYPETQEYVRRVNAALGQSLPMTAQIHARQAAMAELGIQPTANERPAAPYTPPARPRENAPSLPDVQGAMSPPSLSDSGGGGAVEAPQGGLPEMPWTPARKPIEPGLQESLVGATLGSIGTGFVKGVASLIEAPATVARAMGVQGPPMGNEQVAQWLREQVAKPIAPRGEQPQNLMQIAEGIGQTASFMIPGMLVEQGVAGIASQAPRIAAALGATTSGVLQGAVAMTDTYHALTPLVGEEEAIKRAQTAFAANTLLGIAGSALGVFNRWVPEGLSRVVAAAASQGVQGGIQYDVNRRLFWVPGESPNAESLLQMGWERDGDRVVQPYHVKDQLEAALINSVVGGVFGAASEFSKLPIPDALKALKAFQAAAADPGFTVDRAFQAALSPHTPPPDVAPEVWRKWGNVLIDMIPAPPEWEGMRGGIVDKIMSAGDADRRGLLKQRSQLNADLLALDEGGAQADVVMERLGVASPDEAHTQIRTRLDAITTELASTPALPPVQPPSGPPEAPPALPLPTPATLPGAPTLEAGAEGIPAERYRTESGRWRIPLKDMPSRELELQDFIRQQGGINLSRETDVPGELRALISPKETGTVGLMNNRGGLSLQQMAERAQEHGFLASADKESLLHGLSRSVTEGQNMYSVYATGRVPLLDNPHVEAAYQHTLDAIRSLDARTEEQIRGTRPHADAIAEAQAMIDSGGWTYDDVRELMPGTVLDDTGLGQVVLSMGRLAAQLQSAAQRVVETGGRPGSSEVQDYLAVKAMFAELDPGRRGVIAEAGRSLSFLNEPMSGYNRYLNELHEVSRTQGAETVLSMARKDLAIATPRERAEAEAAAKVPLTGEQARAIFEEQQRAIAEMQTRELPADTPEAQQRLLAHLPRRDVAPSDVALAREAGLGREALQTIQANLGMAKPGLGKMFVEQWTASLMGVPTQIANTLANTAMGLYNFPVRLLAEGVSPLRQGIESLVGRTPEPGVMRGETMAMVSDLFGLTQGTMDQWRLLAKFREHARAGMEMWRTGESQFATDSSKLDLHTPAVTAENVGALLGIDPNSPTAKIIAWWGEYVGFLSGGRQVFRALNMSDEFYKSFNYSLARAALAHAEAVKQGLQGLPYREQIARVMADPTTAARIDQGALDAAIRGVLGQAVNPQGIGGAFANLAEKEWLGIPVGRMLIPFTKIPINSASWVWDNTPLAPLTTRFRQAMAQGGRAADMAIAQTVLGTMTMTAVAGLVAAGSVTGRAPTDPELRAVWLKRHPEYAIHLPGVGWVGGYQRWLGPLGQTIGAIADVAQLTGEISGSMAERLAAATFWSFSKNIWHETAAQNLSDLFEALTPGRGDEAEAVFSKLWRFGRRQLLSLTPGLGAANLRSVVRAFEPETMYVNSLMDDIYSRIPGWGTSQVPRRRTITGEPQLFGNGIGPDTLKAFTRAFFPGKFQNEELFAADAAIADNDMALTQVSNILDRHAPGMGQQASTDLDTLKGLPGAKLSADEHERLIVLAALNETEAQKLYGTTERVIPSQVMQLATMSGLAAQAAGNPMIAPIAPPKAEMSLGEMLDWLTTTPAFAGASPGRGGGKEAMFQTVIHKYREYGKALFLELEPDIGERHAQAGILHTIQRLPEHEREQRRLILQAGETANRVGTRAMLGLPPLNVGAQ